MRVIKRIVSTLTLLTLVLLGACGLSSCGKQMEKSYSVGVDPSFFPLEVEDQTSRIFVFSDELLREISTLEGINIVRKNMSWDNLLGCLRECQCSAILSAIPPNIVTRSKYSFSKPYLSTGVVLVVHKNDRTKSLADLAGQTVAIGKTNQEIELISHFPKIQNIFYDNLVTTLENVSSGKYKACLVPHLLAEPYVRDLFHETLVINSEYPLTNEGLRLVTPLDMTPELIEAFDRGLDKMQRSGSYEALLRKWDLF